jgi:sortase A
MKSSDAEDNPAASETVPTNTPAAPIATVAAQMPQSTATPKKPPPDAATLPNGVRYGDHKPNLLERIVRIASANIRLDAPVYEVYAKNNQWEVANYAAGHHYNSKNPGEGGNIVLSGHNNWRGEVFRYLENFKAGDEIDLWTLEGKQYKYRVEKVEKLKEAGASLSQRLSNGQVMDATPNEQLTLITCWPYTTFTHRLIVTAKPVQ